MRGWTMRADLYRQGIAPLVITLGGGSDKDSGKTEGGVGRDYLLARGVPLADIIAETSSMDTEQQVHPAGGDCTRSHVAAHRGGIGWDAHVPGAGAVR